MNEKIKATIVVGGRWHAFDLARGLKNRGALHRLVTNYPWSKVEKWGFSRDEVVTLTSSQWLNQIVQRTCPARWRTRFQYLIHRMFADAAARHLEGSRVVHGWSSFSEPSIRQCHEWRIPFVLERGSSHILTQCRLLEEEERRTGVLIGKTHPMIVEMELREYTAATMVAVPSQFVKGTFLDNGYPAERLLYNPLGVDLQQFRPAAGPKLRSGFRVIYAGSLTCRKGVHYLVEAFRRATINGATLTLVGGPSNETAQLIGEPPRGLERHGHIRQKELVQYYQQSDVFAIASIEEGMAMVQAQALASGLALICTTNTGGEDLLRLTAGDDEPVDEGDGIRRYPAGFVVPIRNPGAIARCLRRLNDEPALLVSQQKAAVRLRELDLDWQAYADRALTAYEKIL